MSRIIDPGEVHRVRDPETGLSVTVLFDAIREMFCWKFSDGQYDEAPAEILCTLYPRGRVPPLILAKELLIQRVDWLTLRHAM